MMANAWFEERDGEVLELDEIEETCCACGRDDIRVNGSQIDGASVARRYTDGSILCDECWTAKHRSTLGYLQAPVVVVDEHTHWSGFRPDKIDELKNRLKENHE